MLKNIVIGVLAVLVVALGVAVLGGRVLVGSGSSTDHYFAESFLAGLTSSGATTLSGTNTLSGATTISGTAAVSQSVSSTLKIGNNSSGLGVGCLVLGDSGASTTQPVYITATGATITASTTKPAICK